MLRAFTGSMIAAIYVKYLLLNGLDLFQANLINCAFYGALILFDVPTGAFADVFGRKKVKDVEQVQGRLRPASEYRPAKG